MTKSRVLKLILYPIIAFITWWLMGGVLTLVGNLVHVQIFNFGFFNYIYMVIPFLIASALFWFNENPKSAFILGFAGGVLFWFILTLVFAISKDFNPQNNFLIIDFGSSFISGLSAWLVSALRKK